MKRRQFITLLGGATAAWPLAARAQQPERMRRIGVLIASAVNDPEWQARIAAFLQGLAAIGLDRRPQPAGRYALVHYQCRRPSQTRRRIGRAGAGRPPGCEWHHNRGGVAAGDPHRADRIRDRRRPGRRRFCRQPRPAGRQRHRFPLVRIRPEREVAGAAQRDRAPHDAGGGAAGSGHRLRDRAVRRHPGGGAVLRSGVEPGRRARCARDRARRRGVRGRSEWRADRAGESGRDIS